MILKQAVCDRCGCKTSEYDGFRKVSLWRIDDDGLHIDDIREEASTAYDLCEVCAHDLRCWIGEPTKEEQRRCESCKHSAKSNSNFLVCRALGGVVAACMRCDYYKPKEVTENE